MPPKRIHLRCLGNECLGQLTGEARRLARAEQPHVEVGRGLHEHHYLVHVVGERLRREAHQVFAAHTRRDQTRVRRELALLTIEFGISNSSTLIIINMQNL